VSEFIDEDIDVRIAEKPGPPTSFVWRGAEYVIAEIVQQHTQLDLQAAWWKRRHRDYYVVRTATGETFEIYFNRGPGRRYWVLYRRLDSG